MANSDGRVFVTEHKRHLILNIGPRDIKWRLMSCNSDTFTAYWPSGIGELNMLPEDQALVRFIAGTGQRIMGMRVDYLNTDGTGVL